VVILHADAVGSTALVRRDEQIAHERIQDAFRRFSEVIGRYGGIPRELRGDALLAEFSRASDAVCAALAFQRSNAEHNVAFEDAISPKVRVGISLGEVVIADETLTGPDVVLAQRLEQLAEPEGVCISVAVQQALPERLPFNLTDLGAQEVKGFEQPVRTFAVAMRLGESLPEPELQAFTEARIERPRRQWIAGAVVVVFLVAGGFAAWLQPWKPAPGVVATESSSEREFDLASNGAAKIRDRTPETKSEPSEC
jgi:class 3 adenylate cyclase